MAEEIKVNLTIEEGANVEAVVRAAESAGLKVERSLESIGVISGVIDAASLETLRRIPQIVNVERAREIKIPGPGSPIQ